MVSRRTVVLGGIAALVSVYGLLRLPDTARAGNTRPFPEPDAWAAKLIAAAESQIGQTVLYDPAYTRIPYPMGDVPPERGVCTDVIIRAYRQAAGIDLQERVHRDMKAAFDAYPKSWGAKRPDTSIDHRRAPNLAMFFQRAGAALPVTSDARDYRPGDIITQMLPGNLPHIGIVTHRPSPDGTRPLVVHNIGAGTKLEDRLFEFRITGHFRYAPRLA
ncbi:hypothetical protein EV217_3204 [Phyllobacterium myrsinacearum]|uniref:DUF1287 domain-containing protein n=1 Tax=Phyllobacterium myrsinacearum TaxID=28101 RepID=UPI001029C5F6|nr:DUF1287 domain-containing protein [Phyllobacterium myrsinacearum]RZS82385.1 hypothetical protein EV217_3204 [Phyllobacterium myrsinacearum]